PAGLGDVGQRRPPGGGLHLVGGGGPVAAPVRRPQRRGAGGLPVSELHSDDELAALETAIDGWLAAERSENPVVAAVDRDQEMRRRWYVRLRGEVKDFTTVWLTLGQRTLRYETYVLPAPEENHAAFYEHLLRRNDGLVGAHFSIGAEDAVFLRGEL